MKQKENYPEREACLPFFSDIYPDRAQYQPGQEVGITIEVKNPYGRQLEATLTIAFTRLERVVYKEEIPLKLEPLEERKLRIAYTPEPEEWAGYGADAVLAGEGRVLDRLSTAFDIASSWKKAIRYGFLCDFYESEEEDTSDVEQMAKFHLNAVQFYDWMYRHEDLLPEEEYFTDPLNRKLSMRAVRKKLEACHQYGMKALAYGSVYGASYDYYKTHKEWALYGNDGNAAGLGENWLVIMNTSPESPWFDHIVKEYKKAVEMVGFDGIQLDTYGFPKAAYSMVGGHKKLERLDAHFPELINATRRSLEGCGEEIGLIFNAVNNWPVDAVAAAAQDAVYVEVWDPNDRYLHIQQIIRNAREKGKKPVILAAYLKAFAEPGEEARKSAENCFLLASACIFANGAYHILLGEYNGLLTEGYFVRYSVIDREFVRTVRNYYDFIVRYARLLYDPELEELTMTHTGGINDEFKFSGADFSTYGEPGKVWIILKEKPGYTVIHLINLTGIRSDIWNEGKDSRPARVEGIHVEAVVPEEGAGVFVASPDPEGGAARELAFEYSQKGNGRYVVFDVPALEVWNLIYIKKKKEQAGE